MTNTADHRVAIHQLAAQRRMQGKAAWEHRVTVDLTGKTNFEERRDQFVRAIRASRWFKSQEEGSELEMLVEELEWCPTADDFDHVMGSIYDAADWDRVWFAVTY